MVTILQIFMQILLFPKKVHYGFPRGGLQRPFGAFPKILPFLGYSCSLVQEQSIPVSVQNDGFGFEIWWTLLITEALPPPAACKIRCIFWWPAKLEVWKCVSNMDGFKGIKWWDWFARFSLLLVCAHIHTCKLVHLQTCKLDWFARFYLLLQPE